MYGHNSLVFIVAFSDDCTIEVATTDIYTRVDGEVLKVCRDEVGGPYFVGGNTVDSCMAPCGNCVVKRQHS